MQKAVTRRSTARMRLGVIGWACHKDDKHRRAPLYTTHIHPDGTRFATGGRDQVVRIWDMSALNRTLASTSCEAEVDADGDSEARLLSTLTSHNGSVLCVRFASKDPNILASAADDHIILIWRREAQSANGTAPMHPSAMDIDVSGGSREVWKPIKRLVGHSIDVTDLAWAPEDAFFASCCLDGRVIVWSTTTYDKLKCIAAHSGFAKGIAWDPLGNYLASQSDDRTVKIWRTSDWAIEVVITSPYHNSPAKTFFRRLSWSPAGTMLATPGGTNGNTPVMALIQRGSEWKADVSFVGHEFSIEVAKFNPRLFRVDAPAAAPSGAGIATIASDSIVSYCAVAAQDHTITIWSTKNSRVLIAIQDILSQHILDLAWSPDGQTLLACSKDGSIAAIQFEENELGLPVDDKAVAEPCFVPLPRDEADKSAVHAGPALVDASAAAKVMLDVSESQPVINPPAAQMITMVGGKKRIQPTLVSALPGSNVQIAAIAAAPKSLPSAPASSGRATPQAGLGEGTAAVKPRGRPRKSIGDQPSMLAVAAPTISLPMPKIPPTLSRISTTNALNRLDITNRECACHISCFVDGIALWKTILPVPVTAVDWSLSFIAAYGSDATVNVLDNFGVLIFPPIVLPSAVAFSAVDKSFLFCLTSCGHVYVWDIEHREAIHVAVSISSLLPPVVLEKKITVGAVQVYKNGVPVVVLTSGQVFALDSAMKSWMRIIDGPTYNSALPTSDSDSPSASTNALDELEILARKNAIVGLTTSSLATTSLEPDVVYSRKIRALEVRLRSAEILGSFPAFYAELLRYAQLVAENQDIQKATILCQRLLSNSVSKNMRTCKEEEPHAQHLVQQIVDIFAKVPELAPVLSLCITPGIGT